jgi:hypothetical protein
MFFAALHTPSDSTRLANTIAVHGVRAAYWYRRDELEFVYALTAMQQLHFIAIEMAQESDVASLLGSGLDASGGPSG